MLRVKRGTTHNKRRRNILAQTKGYAKAKGTRFVDLHILFVCGDYSFPIRPVLRVWRITFTQAEIDENWDVIIGFVRYYEHLDAEEQMRDTAP